MLESEVVAGDAGISLVTDVKVAGATLASMEGEAWSVAVNCVCAEGQSGTGWLAGADVSGMFKQWPLREGRQVVHVFPSFTQEQFLHFPSPLHRQQTTSVNYTCVHACVHAWRACSAFVTRVRYVRVDIRVQQVRA